MNRFLSECLNMKAPGGTKTEKDAVSAMYRRYGRACRDVLALADGSSELAIRGVHAIGAKFEDKGLSWTLDTIAKHFVDWKINPKGFLSGK